MEDVFIFTEAYGCPQIANFMLESYHKFHNIPIHIFGRREDFKLLYRHENNEYIDLTDDDTLKKLYKKGHEGTAYVFLQAIKQYSGNKKYLIHIDSDVIFRQESLSLIIEQINMGHDLIGPRRCYKYNLNNRHDIKYLNDVVQTCFFGFNKKKISLKFNDLTLLKMIAGIDPYEHPTIDFFDAVSFDIQRNDGKTFYLDFEKVGGQDKNGSKENKYGELNSFMDFSDNIIHWGGVASGYSIYHDKEKEKNSIENYAKFAKNNFGLFWKIMTGEHLLNVEIDGYKYLKIKKALDDANYKEQY